MNRSSRFGVWLIAVLVMIVSGCGWWGEEEEEVPTEDFPELGTASDSPESEEASEEEKGQEPLALNLKVGDRFPLIKTVQHKLSQATQLGVVTSKSKLELLLGVTVEEIKNNRKRMRVRYHRVLFEYDVGGEKVKYDSRNSQSSVPPEFQAYAGLLNNGFSFWLGPDNQIVELVGFQEFLKKCVEDVPADQRQEVLTQLTALSGEEEIANFVDDSIGLLPSSTDEGGEEEGLEIGHTWTVPRQVVRPLPMYVKNKYTLKSLDERVAEIDILGTVSPSTTYGPSQQKNSDVQVTVQGGRSFGSCTIDRKTGLPILSRVERYLDMSVRVESGQEFDQRKHTVTTIRAFPEQGEAEQALQQKHSEGHKSHAAGHAAHHDHASHSGGSMPQQTERAASSPNEPSEKIEPSSFTRFK